MFPMPNLKDSNEPVYDTLYVEKYDTGPKSFHLFVQSVGQMGPRGPKSHKDTNIRVGGVLGIPLEAKWTWMRLVVEEWAHPEDVRDFVTGGSVELVIGSIPVVQRAFSAFTPILPKGGEKVIEEWLSGGVIEFWPWLQAPIGPIELDAITTYGATVSTNLSRLRGPLTAKIVLGPILRVPDGRRKVHPDDQEDPYDLFSSGQSEPEV